MPLDRQIAEQITDGQESIGAWHSTPSGRKPVYKLPTQEEPLDDSERLEEFTSLVGIDINDLTPKEQDMILDLLSALDTGYEFSSKKGVPIKAYYGDRANSQKTQRSKLFKKIKRLVDNYRLTK